MYSIWMQQVDFEHLVDGLWALFKLRARTPGIESSAHWRQNEQRNVLRHKQSKAREKWTMWIQARIQNSSQAFCVPFLEVKASGISGSSFLFAKLQDLRNCHNDLAARFTSAPQLPHRMTRTRATMTLLQDQYMCHNHLKFHKDWQLLVMSLVVYYFRLQGPLFPVICTPSTCTLRPQVDHWRPLLFMTLTRS